jgi:hypothetical protein
LSGGFALFGVGLSNGLASRREKRAFQQESALQLAEVERHIWASDWRELQIQLELLEARFAVAGIPAELGERFTRFRILLARPHALYTPDPEPDDPEIEWGIRTDLLDARRLVYRAIRAYLLRTDRRRRSALRDEAIEAVQGLLEEDRTLSSSTRPRSRLDNLHAEQPGPIRLVAVPVLHARSASRRSRKSSMASSSESSATP